ncbi:MAG: RNA polymerase sigma factor [Candidatus Nealsonbacteria bacterium]|nr:RNA polymerase sigma factor [Candidatus Nealsonbacteria bacterium]
MNRPPASQHTAEAEPQPSGARLEEAFARHQDELLGTLYYLLGNTEDARDAVQEAFVKCWRNRGQVPEVKNLRAWIFRIAVNTGRDLRKTAWRRRRRPLEAAEGTLVAKNVEPAADAARREQLELVRQCLRKLRPEEQEVFLLRQNGEMTYQQIAEAISIPVGTVKTRMRLALTKLRGALEV